ncbi:hypothetical protein GCM10022251_22450 [Phytohabitans flavus]|uniref:DUF7700 domain-containing protein n=1 Tax=Phytohabitans flavus TaxID=1076124 RepID=A0A6F8XRY6_9ACTN|nr:hypothetical protein [Phytohabitans flavus]BCB76576.1 hypothetical protein Pflav_029860 [Phytohabitans flavus]
MSLTEMRVGNFIESIPVPHEPEKTRYFPAGSLTIGLEYRVFDPVEEAKKLTAEEIAATGPDSLFHRQDTDQGVSLHVFATDGLAEYLRFDCFADEPHYHYIAPERGNMLVHFDEVTNGPMLDWALRVVRTRAPQMLTAIGADALAASVDADLLNAALNEAAEAAQDYATA